MEKNTGHGIAAAPGWCRRRTGLPRVPPLAFPLLVVLLHVLRADGFLHDSAEARSLEAYPLAKCLDGSPARYYLSKGNASRVFVFFEGGGFCQDLSACQTRAASYLGSTLQDPPSLALDRPYFTRSPAASPLLSSFTFAFVRYCDGGYFSGDRLAPVVHNGTSLHFLGRWILGAVFADLKLAEASDVVIGGCSAGGIHVLAHLDAMRDMLPSSVRVSGFADSGFFMDVDFFTGHKRFVVSPAGQNGQRLLSPTCTAEFPQEKEKCLIAQRSAPFLQTPTFVWQSRFDLDQRSCELLPDCAASPPCVEAYARNMSSAIREQLLARRRPHGAFIDVCARHCDDGVKQLNGISVDGVTPLQALALWYFPEVAHNHTHDHTPHSRTLWEAPGVEAMC
jgi:O-palmitoleoyl-L-serine hydrolase